MPLVSFLAQVDFLTPMILRISGGGISFPALASARRFSPCAAAYVSLRRGSLREMDTAFTRRNSLHTVAENLLIVPPAKAGKLIN